MGRIVECCLGYLQVGGVVTQSSSLGHAVTDEDTPHFCPKRHRLPILWWSVGATKCRGMVSMFDPWAEIGRHPEVTVFVRRLDDGVVGLTDGCRRIWLDSRLNQAERRCVLTHEWRHVLLGHKSCQPLAVELDVCQWAARKLITMDDLYRVMPWSNSLEELAEELAVTPQTLRDRLVGLTPEENAVITSWEVARAA